eukprot:2386117-Rhodomonas_salina.4
MALQWVINAVFSECELFAQGNATVRHQSEAVVPVGDSQHQSTSCQPPGFCIFSGTCCRLQYCSGYPCTTFSFSWYPGTTLTILWYISRFRLGHMMQYGLVQARFRSGSVSPDVAICVGVFQNHVLRPGYPGLPVPLGYRKTVLVANFELRTCTGAARHISNLLESFG